MRSTIHVPQSTTQIHQMLQENATEVLETTEDGFARLQLSKFKNQGVFVKHYAPATTSKKLFLASM